MTGNTGKRALPQLPNSNHLRKQAKARLAAMKAKVPSARLADAQLILAREYGFPNWAALQAEVARRAQGPLGQHAHVRRVHLASLDPGRWFGKPPDEEDLDSNRAFFFAGAIAQTGFLLAVLAGVGLLIWVMKHLGIPFWPAR